MTLAGNRPPGTIPNKAIYLSTDLQRNSRYFKIKLQQPTNFPVITLNPMRVLIVVSKKHPNFMPTLMRKLWNRYWQLDLDVIEDQSLIQAMEESGISHANALEILKLSKTNEYKDLLKTETSAAVEKYHMFGAPTFICNWEGDSEKKIFFGSDRFHIFANEFELNYDGPTPSSSTSRL